MGSVRQTSKVFFMSLVYRTSLVSLADLIMSQEQECDTLALRNRDVVETLSPVSDLGQDTKKEFDELQLRNRTVTETLSPLEELGQDKKDKKKPEGNGDAGNNGQDASNGDTPINPEDYDKLELRNRTVTETLSPVDDLGQDRNGEDSSEDEEEEYDTLHLRNRVVTETLSPVEDLGQDPPAKKQKYDTLKLRNRDVTETLSPIGYESK